MAVTRDEIRSAAEQVLGSDGYFAILASAQNPSWYLQWLNQGGGVYVEVADPAYNGEPPLDGQQLEAVAELGFEKRDVNFAREFAPGEHDADSLVEFLLRCSEDIFAVTDVSELELSVNE